MFTTDALARAARPAFLARGRMIARHDTAVSERKLTYRDGDTQLSARVASASGYQQYYTTTLVLDEKRDRVVSFACDCPAAYTYPGPCKHALALGYDYAANPDRWRGYDAMRNLTTSPVLADYLDRAQQVAPPAQRMRAAAPGTVSLELTLAVGNGSDIRARFRVVGSDGAYVMKNIGDFIRWVQDGAYVEYGKKLALVHEEATFDPHSWQVVQWLERCVLNRRAFSAERLYGRYYATYSSGSAATTGRELHLSSPEVDDLLALYSGTSLILEPEGRQRTVTVVDGNPDLSLTVRAAQDGAYELVRGKERLFFFSTQKRSYAVGKTRLYRMEGNLDAVRDFLSTVYASRTERLYVSAQDAPRFAATTLPALEDALGTTAPSELDALKPVACALSFYLDRDADSVTVDVVAAYGDKTYRVLERRAGEARDLTRDLTAETAARQLVSMYFMQVTQAGGPAGAGGLPAAGSPVAAGVRQVAGGPAGADATSRAAAPGEPVWMIPAKDSGAVARLVFGGVAKMRELGAVYTTPAFDRLVSGARPRVHLGVSAGEKTGLIKLTVETDDLPLDELYALLGSYRQKKHYHRLRDGSFVDLSGLDLDEAANLADELGLTSRQLASGVVEMPSYKAFLLDNMLSDDEKDASFDRWIDDFRSVDPSVYRLPAGLALGLRGYQRQGYQWLSALADMGFGGILADEMGLGKTAQLIAFLLARRGRGRSLVVCPASLVYNWEAEFAKFAPQMDVAVVAGSAHQRAQIMAQAGHEVLITSYDLLRRDVEHYAGEEYFCIVLDEAQYIKNQQTLAARAVKVLAGKHRFALTGTPIENRLSELWSIFDFLMPGLFGSYERFRDRYEQPIVSGDEAVTERLRAAVGPFILRRLKKDVLTDLPDKLETPVVAQMGREQSKLYRAREQALRISLSRESGAEGMSKLQVLTELTRLRQLCCDPRLVYEDYKGGSCKIDTIWQLVAASVDAGAKVLVFSQFTSFLALIADRLRREHVAYYELTGKTPKEQRVRLVDTFNADDTPVFLISLKAGGTGLNLTGAQVVIHADPWWNLAAEDQATDRAHRIGQQNDVTVYKVICKGTIEERILALQAAKADLADAVVGTGGGGGLGSLDRQDLLELLG